MVSVSRSRQETRNRPKLRRRKRGRRCPSRVVSVKFLAVIILVLTLATTLGLVSPSWAYILFAIPNRVWQMDFATSISSRAKTMTTKTDGGKFQNPNAQHFSVIIVGAGIAGLTAAKTLEREGLSDFLVLEATSQWGGRIRSASTKSITSKLTKEKQFFYPVDMGASFITDPEWLPVIAGKDVQTPFHGDGAWDWTTTPISEEWKEKSDSNAHDIFRNYSWYEFVKDYLLPTSESESELPSQNNRNNHKIRYSSVVDKIETLSPSKPSSAKEGIGIDGRSNRNVMQVSCGPSFFVTADAVLVTIPLPLLQEPLEAKQKRMEAIEDAIAGEEDDDNDKVNGKVPMEDDLYDDDVDGEIFRHTGLQFDPPLPGHLQDQIREHKATMLPALKIVFEFKHKFYPDYIDLTKQAEAAKGDAGKTAPKLDAFDVGVNPKFVYEYWADSDGRYDPRHRRPTGARHYLVGQLLGEPAKAYFDFFYGPKRENGYYRTQEFHDDMAKHLLQEFISYMEIVKGFDAFLVHQNFVGYQIVHWTQETFSPGILDCTEVSNEKTEPYQAGEVPHANDQLYFAGEAFANLPTSIYGGCGQAHGAAISGKQAAHQILHSLQSKAASPSSAAVLDSSEHGSSSSILHPREDLTYRDLERFSIVRPEDAEDMEFYAPFNQLFQERVS